MNSGLTIRVMLTMWLMTSMCTIDLPQTTAKGPYANRSSVRGYDRVGISFRQIEYEVRLVRVSEEVEASVMINSDPVAYERDTLAIRDRRLHTTFA